MPTMTNPETGETMEMSMEELLEAMREGKVTVQQQVHHADGTVTSSAIFGNDVGDGIDRSLNIFGTMNDVFSVAIQKARRIKEADENAENLFCMDDSDLNYEVTIDDTAMPIMHIVTCTENNVRIARYMRDERKTVGAPMQELNLLFENGEISATLEEVQENNLALAAFAVHELRRVLREQGILQDIQEIGNRSSGVVVTATEDDIDAKIVRGRARPDLPCMMFGGLFAQSLDEAVMMRPYVDELMVGSMFDDMPLEEKIAMAEAGDESMMTELAIYYLNESDEPDPEKAVYWFAQLAELDDSDAQFNMGLHCAKGFGVERSFEKAVYWLERAAENGDEDAPALIEKLKKAVTAEKIADTGDAQAQADLAEVYMFIGNSLGQADPDADYAIALEYAQKSAAQNNGDGLWALALAYEHGRGIEEDVEKAIECYRKGAELGHAPSQHSLACYYFRGDVLEEDHEKAFALCMKSAEQGYGLAMRDVGRAYQFGNGVDDNMSLAIDWYEKALKVIADPELELKVAVFKMMEEGGAFADNSDEDDIDDFDMPDGMLEAIELQEFAEEAGYHNIADDRGVFTIGDEKMIVFVTNLANEGNEEAQLVLARYFLANECTAEQRAQAITWLKELAEKGDVAAQLILEGLA